MSERIDMIREKLTAALSPEQLDIIDESHLHAGHPGARGGGGHFNVTIVSKAFEGESLLARHRMVYDALGDAMKNEIHALSIKANTPEESQN
jgi:BolA protein